MFSIQIDVYTVYDSFTEKTIIIPLQYVLLCKMVSIYFNIIMVMYVYSNFYTSLGFTTRRLRISTYKEVIICLLAFTKEFGNRRNKVINIKLSKLFFKVVLRIFKMFFSSHLT